MSRQIDRRNFLFGTVAAASAGTALVLTAPKEAVKLFQPTLEETVALTRVPQHSKRVPQPEMAGQFYLAVIDADGRRHEATGVMLEFNITASVDTIMTATFGGYAQEYQTAGPRERRIELTWPYDGRFIHFREPSR